jgi:hypothetical protein
MDQPISPRGTVAKHHIRRSLQFGILDLLILTMVAAIVFALCRPAHGKATKAPPWVVGFWKNDESAKTILALYPDGMYESSGDQGTGWKVTRGSEVESAFVLVCGEERFIIRSEWGSGVMELLNGNGKVQHRLQQWIQFEGVLRGGVPHGMWVGQHVSDPEVCYLLQYRDGELVDLHWKFKRDLSGLNRFRAIQGFPPLSERDFPYP